MIRPGRDGCPVEFQLGQNKRIFADSSFQETATGSLCAPPPPPTHPSVCVCASVRACERACVCVRVEREANREADKGTLISHREVDRPIYGSMYNTNLSLIFNSAISTTTFCDSCRLNLRRTNAYITHIYFMFLELYI